MRAAVAALRQQQPAHMVVAGPVAASSTCDEFKTEVDDIVCAARPEPFYAVGLWYENFSPTSDAEVRDLLHGQPSGKPPLCRRYKPRLLCVEDHLCSAGFLVSPS